MQACSELNDKQITKEISDFLSAEKASQTNRANILISLSAFERRLGQKFKCSAELDRNRITKMLEAIIASRNKYLESSSKGSSVPLFVLSISEPEVRRANSNEPKGNFLGGPGERSAPENLSPCFSGIVQVSGENINIKNWPDGLLLVPNFLTESQQLFFRNNVNDPVSSSGRLECLLGLFSEYKFAPSIPGKTLIHPNPPRSPNLKINVVGTVLLLSIGETSLSSISYKGINVHIPLVSGSLLRLDSSLRDWNVQISSPKTGMNLIVEFKFPELEKI
jgi:hypothetical protein